ncbi:uncharacterized protein G2W53_005450 [Senna tora]|uniref:Uncharacterized protein n=1 Tax=Senna tora TaxID=362788 RepID=A0A834X3M1_9FABA|nr:uncharacterized protein G2W53_005450 [Senna tora]
MVDLKKFEQKMNTQIHWHIDESSNI